jgi:hypothetical protein
MLADTARQAPGNSSFLRLSSLHLSTQNAPEKQFASDTESFGISEVVGLRDKAESNSQARVLLGNQLGKLARFTDGQLTSFVQLGGQIDETVVGHPQTSIFSQRNN